jgi:hypothetical protein
MKVLAAVALLALSLVVPGSARAQSALPEPEPVNVAEAPALVSVKPPRDMDGVLLVDGTQIEGEVEERANRRWIITPKSGKKRNVHEMHIVYAEKGGEWEVKGEDSAAAAVWRAAVRDASDKATQIDVLNKGVEWCGKRGFVTAATCLLNDLGKLDPSIAGLDERAGKLMPEAFFFKEAADAAKQWRTWADALLPSSAQFIAKDDEAWERVPKKPWPDGQTIGFRTRNVILFVRDHTPLVCGKALQMAEGTCRALQFFLKDGEPDFVPDDQSRLEIRIHKDREGYLSEELGNGKTPGAWTAGVFSPSENVSRFYVDRRGKSGGPNMIELSRVLPHEFTHHYLFARWTVGQNGGNYGFWVVEGMAEFVQNQLRGIDKRGLKFDDDAAEGNRQTAVARKMGLHLKTQFLKSMDRFMDMAQANFQALSDDSIGGGPSERNIWYDQAGALSYFFLVKKGPEMRQKFLKYVKRHYARHLEAGSWKELGYESAQQLDDEFSAFLRTIGG